MSSKKVFFLVESQGYLMCVPCRDMSTADPESVAVGDENVPFKYGAQTFKGEILSISKSEKEILRDMERLKKQRRRKDEGSFHAELPRKAKQKAMSSNLSGQFKVVESSASVETKRQSKREKREKELLKGRAEAVMQKDLDKSKVEDESKKTSGSQSVTESSDDSSSSSETDSSMDRSRKHSKVHSKKDVDALRKIDSDCDSEAQLAHGETQSSNNANGVSSTLPGSGYLDVNSLVDGFGEADGVSNTNLSNESDAKECQDKDKTRDEQSNRNDLEDEKKGEGISAEYKKVDKNLDKDITHKMKRSDDDKDSEGSKRGKGMRKKGHKKKSKKKKERRSPSTSSSTSCDSYVKPKVSVDKHGSDPSRTKSGLNQDSQARSMSHSSVDKNGGNKGGKMMLKSTSESDSSVGELKNSGQGRRNSSTRYSSEDRWKTGKEMKRKLSDSDSSEDRGKKEKERKKSFVRDSSEDMGKKEKVRQKSSVRDSSEDIRKKEKERKKSLDFPEDRQKQVKRKSTDSDTSEEAWKKEKGRRQKSSDSDSSGDGRKHLKRKRRHRSPSSSDSEKERKPKVRRNRSVYSGVNYQYKEGDVGVERLHASSDVWVKSLDLSDAKTSARSPMGFIRIMTDKVYTMDAIKNSTAQGFPSRSLGSKKLSKMQVLPAIHPDGRTAIIAAAKELENERKLWRPRRDMTTLSSAFSQRLSELKN